MKYRSPAGKGENPMSKSKPSLSALSHALRNPDQWPKDFGPWDYSCYGTCAVGLAAKMWSKEVTHGKQSLEELFGLTESQGSKIFSQAGIGLGLCTSSVRPEQVADLIDELV
jgi:hypothetical protein